MPALLLFDLDGTLMRARAGRLAFRRLFARHCGIPECDNGMDFGGKTDVALFREIMDRYGISGVDTGALVPLYLQILAGELAADPGRVLPGVRELLDALAARPEAYSLALGTGNLEQGARLKLAPHGLNRYFPTGGFGSDSEIRDELIRVAVEKARRHYERDFDRVIVIGDTPRDVACGQANGAATLAVATGPADLAALQIAGADAVLPDFADRDTALRTIAGLAGAGR